VIKGYFSVNDLRISLMKLHAPDGAEIVSILLNDGTASDFEFYGSTKNGETTIIYELPKGNTAKVAKKNGDSILIDENRKHWASSDIEYENAGKFANH